MWGYVAAYLAGLTTIPAIVLALGALADFGILYSPTLCLVVVLIELP
jgi:hypothetical protein